MKAHADVLTKSLPEMTSQHSNTMAPAFRHTLCTASLASPASHQSAFEISHLAGEIMFYLEMINGCSASHIFQPISSALISDQISHKSNWSHRKCYSAPRAGRPQLLTSSPDSHSIRTWFSSFPLEVSRPPSSTKSLLMYLHYVKQYPQAASTRTKGQILENRHTLWTSPLRQYNNTGFGSVE